MPRLGLIAFLLVVAGDIPQVTESAHDVIAASSRSEQASDGLTYQVDVTMAESTGPPNIHVTARFPSGVTMVSFPGPSVGIEPAEWLDRWVGELSVHDSADAPVELRPADPGSWTIDGEYDGSLVVSYSVDPAFALASWPAGNEHAAYWEDDALYLVGEALFATPDVAGPTGVVFSLPDGWHVSTPWRRHGTNPSSFVVESSDDLLDNALVLGRHASIDQRLRGFRYELALMGRAADVRDAASRLAGAVLEAYVANFDGAPDGAYLQAMFVSDAEDGEAFRASSGFRTSLVPDEGNILLWGNQLAHELFHRWLASDAAIAAMDYGDGQWLSEGLAEYYANLTLLRVGMISSEEWQRKLEKHVGLYLYYRASPAFNGSLRAAGANKTRERLAVYNGGWTAAFCLDVHTRRATEGRVGLDAFLRGLWTAFGTTGRTYAFEQLPRVYRESTGVDATDIFTRFIDGTEVLPVKECLQNAGLEAGIKGYAGEIWVWPVKEPTSLQRAVWSGLVDQPGS